MADNNWYKPNDKRFTWSPEKLKEVADSLNAWVDKAIESKEDFLLGDWCFHSGLGFLPSYFARYCERSTELDNAYNRAKEWQEHNISKGALFNKLNSKFASLWLSHTHGWKINSSDDTLKKLDSEFCQYLETQREKYDQNKKDED